jgi:hypothetical protein
METIMSTLFQPVLTAKVVHIVPPAQPAQAPDAAPTVRKPGPSLLTPVLPRIAVNH